MSTTLTTYRFTLTLGGVPAPSDDRLDTMTGALLKQGCDDASLWSEGPTVFLSFTRESEALGRAIGSAVEAVERAGFKVANIEVEPDDEDAGAP
jgi:hypothetical protein